MHIYPALPRMILWISQLLGYLFQRHDRPATPQAILAIGRPWLLQREKNMPLCQEPVDSCNTWTFTKVITWDFGGCDKEKYENGDPTDKIQILLTKG